MLLLCFKNFVGRNRDGFNGNTRHAVGNGIAGTKVNSAINVIYYYNNFQILL